MIFKNVFLNNGCEFSSETDFFLIWKFAFYVSKLKGTWLFFVYLLTIRLSRKFFAGEQARSGLLHGKPINDQNLTTVTT